MKKIKNILKLLLIPTISIFPALFTISCGCALNNKKPSKIEQQEEVEEQKQSVLTENDVIDNFKEGGIWSWKTYLTKEDLRGFNVLGRGCFNSLDRDLEYIELPKFMKTKDYQIFNTEKIKEIRVEENSKYFTVLGDIVYYKTYNDFNEIQERWILTIANRVKKIKELDLSYHWDLSLLFRLKDNISDNFYNEKIFENVEKINIDYLYVKYIGKNAFSSCQKLSTKILISPIFGRDLIIGGRAFDNTNISTLWIINLFDYGDQNKIIINNFAFENCYNLSDINFLNMWVHIKDEAFAVDKNIPSRKINFFMLYDSYIILEQNVFKGNYDNFSINFSEELEESSELDSYKDKYEWDRAIHNKSLSNIESKNFEFVLKIKKITQEWFLNKGLTEEQYNKIQKIKKI